MLSPVQQFFLYRTSIILLFIKINNMSEAD